MFRGQPYTTTADIWSAGIVLYAMTYGRLPFEDPNIQKLVSKIVLDEPKYAESVSSSLIDLLKKMLIKDPKTRIDIEAIRQHPWFTVYKENALDPSWSLLPNGTLDLEVLSEMKKINANVDISLHSLQNHIFDENAAYYRILRQKKITFLMSANKNDYDHHRSTSQSNSLHHFKLRSRALPLSLRSTPFHGPSSVPVANVTILSPTPLSPNPQRTNVVANTGLSIVARHNPSTLHKNNRARSLSFQSTDPII